MSAEPVSTSEIRSTFEKAIKEDGIVIESKDYLFTIYEMAPERWIKASWIFEKEEGYKSTVSTKRALLYLIDEVSESLQRYEKDQWSVILSPAELEQAMSRSEELK